MNIYRFGISPFNLPLSQILFQVLMATTASHSLRKSRERGPSSQRLHGCTTRLRFWDCFLSMQYPINKPVTLFNAVLMKLIHALNLLKLQRPKSSLTWLRPFNARCSGSGKGWGSSRYSSRSVSCKLRPMDLFVSISVVGPDVIDLTPS